MISRARLIVAAIAVVLMSLPVFAQPQRPGPGPSRDERVTAEGRIQSIQPDRDGYRVVLEHGGRSFWVPERVVHGRSRDFRVGISVRLGGIVRGGFIIVDVVDWPPVPPRLRGDIVRGWVDRIDYRHDTMTVREERTERVVRVDMSHVRGFDDLHRGDYVVLSGDWTRGGFDADRIDNVRQRRW